jgi:uncharacterized integral membrane protein
MKKRGIAIIMLAGILVIISIQNTQSVILKFLAWEASISLILLIYIIFIAGLLFGILYARISAMISKRRQKKEPSR